jgi:hypothetical protein
MLLHDKIAYLFTTSSDVLEAVDNLSLLLAVTILLNSVQPVLSGTLLSYLLCFEDQHQTCDMPYIYIYSIQPFSLFFSSP